MGEERGEAVSWYLCQTLFEIASPCFSCLRRRTENKRHRGQGQFFLSKNSTHSLLHLYLSFVVSASVIRPLLLCLLTYLSGYDQTSICHPYEARRNFLNYPPSHSIPLHRVPTALVLKAQVLPLAHTGLCAQFSACPSGLPRAPPPLALSSGHTVLSFPTVSTSGLLQVCTLRLGGSPAPT